MHRKQLFALAVPPPLVAGTGLIALDVILSSNGHQPPRLWAGGTCGNVLTCLSYLGWHAYPVSRLHKDTATVHLLRDLSQWGLHLQFVQTRPGGSTPIIVQQIRQNAAGKVWHTFSWRCPHCGTFFPPYKAVLASEARDIATKIMHPRVFFLDRVSRGALILAQACAAQGALVVFEPSSLGEPRLFREALALTHILKYSHERMGHLGEDMPIPGLLLEVQTLGEAGLRYRSQLPSCLSNGWEQLTAYAVEQVKDTAGAGDWCTAGIIHRLAQTGLQGLLQVTAAQVRDALSFGQALAAWNCGFEGARGGMYSVSQEAFRCDIMRIMSGNPRPPYHVAYSESTATLQAVFGNLCPACRRSEGNITVRAD